MNQCPDQFQAFHYQENNHFLLSVQWLFMELNLIILRGPYRQLPRQEINYSDNIYPCCPAQCNLIVFNTHNGVSHHIIRQEEMHVEQRESNQVCSFMSFCWLKNKTNEKQAPEKKANVLLRKRKTLGSVWGPHKHDTPKGTMADPSSLCRDVGNLSEYYTPSALFMFSSFLAVVFRVPIETFTQWLWRDEKSRFCRGVRLPSEDRTL